MKEQNDIPNWVYDSHIKFHFQTKDIRSSINWSYFNAIKRGVLAGIEAVIGEKISLPLTIAPVHSFTAKTCIEQAEKEYSIVFDCNYGSTVKKLYHTVISKSTLPDLHRFLKEIVAIRILYRGKDCLALALKDEPVSLLYNRNYFNLETELTTALEFYRAIPLNPTNQVNQFIDYYILAHEIFHLTRVELPETFTRYMKTARAHFSFFKDKYYNVDGYPAYKKAQGENSWSPEAINFVELQSQRFWKMRSESYNNQGEHFIEEIAADLFAVDVLLRIATHFSEKKIFSWPFDSIFSTIFLISRTLYYYTFLDERSVDVSNNKEFIYDDQQGSGLLHLRNLCVLEHLNSYIFNCVDESHEYKHMLNESVAESKNYFDLYVQLFFTNPLHYTLKAASAKLKDEWINDVYQATAKGWSTMDKITYVSPNVESIWLSHYLI